MKNCAMPWKGRRRVLATLALLPFAGAIGGEPQAPVRIGLTPVFLDDQAAFLRRWKAYLERRLERPIAFVQRGSYREVYELLGSRHLDFAWLCGFPYVRLEERVKLLAVPVFQGKPLYRSYLIVPASDAHTLSLLDLRGRVFAYSDPDSNSGYLYPRYLLIRNGENPDAFFLRTFYTWAHRKVVEAVASGLAHGGAVDSYVWETLAQMHPELTAKTRVAARSPEFGHPPFVAHSSVSPRGFAALQAALTGMDGDPEGQALLRRLNLDGFSVERPELFDSIARMWRATQGA
jgi:phosphonate transport system substrate-binding protein